MAKSTALSKRERHDLVKSFFEANKDVLKSALPNIGLTKEVMLRTALTAIAGNPVLLECDKGSLFKATLEAAQLGLTFTLGRAYLVPYRNNKRGVMEAQLIPGYLGLLDIARRSGEIKSVAARAVYKGDDFSYSYSLEGDALDHIPGGETDPKDLTHAYCIVHLNNGGYQMGVMNRKELEKVRATSKAGKSGPWQDFYEQMCIKTVIKRVIKLCPASVEMQRAVELDDRSGSEDQFAGDDFLNLSDEDIIDVDPETGEVLEDEKPNRTNENLKETLAAAKKRVADETATVPA